MRKALLAFLLMPAIALGNPGPQSFTTTPPGTLTGNPNLWADNAVPHAQAYASVAHVAILKGANMNTTADQPMVMLVWGLSKYVVTGISATNCTAPPTGAVGGIYTALARGGTAVVAAGQTYTALMTSAAIEVLTNNVATTSLTAPQFYLSLTTASGTAETCDIYVDGIGLQ
ncbi:MAG TPA: hypothetical protein PLO69_10980 [Gammaproteobacteria bacterium]|nr:hypothetical protein [Gammaproteobacteria bacterium]